MMLKWGETMGGSGDVAFELSDRENGFSGGESRVGI
jgi:hypothetical protein